jgi:L-ascorbate metabolism protein UlaG (beta-lactamase superfamily)
MVIMWYGHACFQISGDGVRVVTDPYTPDAANLRPVPHDADIVIMSSDDDSFHSDGASVPGNPVVINALEVARDGGSRTVHGVRFDAVETQESIVHKTDPDPNAIYAWTQDGIRVGHLGDVGNPLTDEQLAVLEGCDVLLALTGGPPTIELDDLHAVIDAVKPRVVIPMHYNIPNLKFNGFELEAFTSRFPADIVTVRPETALELRADRLPDTLRVVALQPFANAPGYPVPDEPWVL